MDDKVLTAAEVFIKHNRMQFPGLYPSDLHLFIEILSSHDYEWNDAGALVMTYDGGKRPYQLTEEGWESAKNATSVPTSWSEAVPASALLNIPDHVTTSWLEQIGMFCWTVAKLNEDDVFQWVSLAQRFTGTMDSSQVHHIRHYMNGFRSVKAAVEKILARVTFIRNERAVAATPKPSPIVEVGATVRYATGVDFATVQKIVSVPGNRESAKVAVLSNEIDGSDYHFVHNLVAVSPPDQSL